MSFSRIKILLLFARYTTHISYSYYDDWQDAFVNRDELETTSVNVCDRSNINLVNRTIKNYDLIVLLHSTNADTLDYISPYINALNNRQDKLVAFIGNELNYPPPSVGMRDKIRFLKSVRADYIATQLPLEAGQQLYSDIAHSKVIAIPHALNPARFSLAIPQSGRKTDIGVRSARYYPFLGDNERTDIIEYFVNNKFEPPLALDISMNYQERLTPPKWAEFLNQCKGTVATEAGTYYLEKDDATAIKVMDYIKSKCGPLQKYSVNIVTSKYKKLIPEPIGYFIKRILKSLGIGQLYIKTIYYAVPFAEIYEVFFKNYPNPLSGKCISSRHFDAIGTKTCQIMFPGRFNGILEAGKHYIALNRDFTNIKEVLDKFRDVRYRTKMVDETYDYIMASHTYKHRIDKIVALMR